MTNFIANLMTNLYDILECQVSEPSSEPHGGGRSRMSFTMSSRMSFTMSFYNVILYDIQTCQVSEPSNKPRGGGGFYANIMTNIMDSIIFYVL